MIRDHNYLHEEPVHFIIKFYENPSNISSHTPLDLLNKLEIIIMYSYFSPLYSSRKVRPIWDVFDSRESIKNNCIVLREKCSDEVSFSKLNIPIFKAKNSGIRRSNRILFPYVSWLRKIMVEFSLSNFCKTVPINQ